MSTVWHASGGETAELIRRTDWSRTSLGPQAGWSASLQGAVRMILASAFPMALRWGHDFVVIYNDAYRPILGDKHPQAFGRPAREAWPEVWAEVAPTHEAILNGEAPSIFGEDVVLRIRRHGMAWEEAHFTVGYSPIEDPGAPTGIGGVLVTAIDITDRVAAQEGKRISEERYELALAAAGAIGTWDWDVVNDRLIANPTFAELYSVDPAEAASGRPLAAFIAGVHPEDQDRLQAGIAQSLEKMEAQPSEYRLLQRDGTIKWVIARGRVHLDGSGQPVRHLGAVVDITDRKRTEEALQESRGFLEDVLKSSGEGFYAIDREGRTTLCNQAFLRMLGFEHEDEVVGRKLHHVIHRAHPDGAPYEEADCPIYLCASTGRAAHVDTDSFHRQNGEAFPVEYWVNPIFRDGRHEGAICTFVDIGKRKAAEAELARSEARFRALTQAVPNHVWVATPDGRLDWVNDRAYEYSGAEPGKLQGAGWIGMVHPEDRPMAEERWRASLESGEIHQVEMRLRRADGQYRWHITRALPIRDSLGRIERWIGTNTDIEEERATTRALAQLNATLEDRVAQQAAERDRIWKISQDLLVVVDAIGRILTVNPSWTSMLGWQSAELIGRHYWELLAPEDRPVAQAALFRALQAPLPALEIRCLHKDGSSRWISWVAASERGLVYATGRNVTAEKTAAADLFAAQEALRQSQKMEAVGQLTGGIAHDFNNMLAVVMGSLELLGRRFAGGDVGAKRCIDSAAEAARRASLLTQRLLAFARQQPLQPESVDVNKLVAGMSDLLRHSIGTEVRLEAVLGGGLWRTHADPNQLENIVLNLALNARDAMRDGGRLTIETQNAHLDDRYVAGNPGLLAGQYVLIAVTDTGSGMTPEVIEKAFDPFFTTKPVGKGTGLGLSQVYGFVKQTGGHVKIYSEVGQGTTVKIYLPRLAGGVEEIGGASADSPSASGGSRECILVVEDEPAVRQFSAEALRELGYRVLEADGASAALALLDAHPGIMLLFTDVVMPDINGAKLAQEARRRRPDLKILFTTGYTRNAVVHNGVLDPGVDMIGKPFSLSALAAKVRLILDG